MTIRVLVVDDSAIVRKMISNALESDSNLEVVCTAPNGEVAIQKARNFKPDVITLDVEMPGMSGLDTLQELIKENQSNKIMMVSAFTEVGAKVTLDALALGASDYITKPSTSSGGLSNSEFSKLLIDKVKSLKPNQNISSEVPTLNPKAENKQKNLSKRTVLLTVIGISTGGPKALASFLPQLESNFPTPILIVQHMPPMFTKLLAERLNEQCKIKVLEAEDGMFALPGVAYIAPGGYHMEVHNDNSKLILKLNQNEPENSCRPAVDVLFRSASTAVGDQLLGIIMTGMGQDGLRGSKLIKEKGGTIFCQDQESSVVWGMPGYVAQAGLASVIAPLSELSKEVTLFINNCNKDAKQRF
jgi:two-component system chemotaxis response regulator CheB